jgi:competence protein ComEC
MCAPALVWIAAASVLGAVVAAPLPADARVCASVAVLALAFALAIAGDAKRHFRVAFAVALVGSLFYAGWREAATPTVAPTRTARFAGTIVGERSGEGDLHSYIFRLDAGPRVLIAVTRALEVGARAIVRGRLEPLDESRNPGEPSERDMEAESHIKGRISGAAVMSISTRSPPSFDAWLASARADALRRLQERLDEPGASIVAGELWGERSQLPPDLRKEFQETGTVHILVTAGLHVGLVAMLALAMFSWMGLPRAFACGSAAMLVWGFACFSGGQLPALRAATMATVALAARACGRASLSWNALAVAAIVIVALEPSSVDSASFWLSFCCVAAIFACAHSIEERLAPLEALPHHLREAMVLTIATQLGTWPVTAAVFLQFAPYALLANLAVVPCVPVTMLLGALQLALSWCGPLAQAAANLNGWILAWMLGAVHLLATAPFAAVPMTPAPIWCVASYEAALISAAPLARRGAQTLAIALLAISSLLVLCPPHAVDGHLRITALDVGQADAIVIQTPAGHVFLVDAGGRLERGSQANGSVAESIGDRIVVPFLLRQGIHHVDALIVSHPHGDHVGGCAPVLRKLRVAEIADSGQMYGGHAYHDCLDTAASYHVPIVRPQAGDVWRTNDGVTLRFIGPSQPFIGGRNAINDNSIAFVLQWRSFRMLLTGDAGIAAERRFLAEGIDLHADVLKVGHHGSAYSSSPAFIDSVHPRYAIISVGRHNLFGHPAPVTVETLRRFGATIYRTDKEGAASIFTDGFNVEVRTYAAPALNATISRRGGDPNMRVYSRLNCDGLS